MNNNIVYSTSEIFKFYSENRIKWSQFYPSEKNVLEYVNPKSDTKVLDIGCGCGGLGMALKEKFGIKDYTGIDINKKAIKKAIDLNPLGNFLNEDFLEISSSKIKNNNLIISLSCIDWNIEFKSMLQKAWSILEEGKFILSIRLTNKDGINDIKKSYQFINFNGNNEGEIAPYNIYNFKKWFSEIKTLSNISEIYCYGYNGKPAKTAITPYKEVCFAVFSLSKVKDFNGELRENIKLPIEFL